MVYINIITPPSLKIKILSLSERERLSWCNITPAEWTPALTPLSETDVAVLIVCCLASWGDASHMFARLSVLKDDLTVRASSCDRYVWDVSNGFSLTSAK